eukprot:213022-Chlamydomonas_euryale.AAC.6
MHWLGMGDGGNCMLSAGAPDLDACLLSHVPQWRRPDAQAAAASTPLGPCPVCTVQARAWQLARPPLYLPHLLLAALGDERLVDVRNDTTAGNSGLQAGT